MNHFVGMKDEVTEFVCPCESLDIKRELQGNADQSFAPVQQSCDGEPVASVPKPAEVRTNPEFDLKNLRYDQGIKEIDRISYAVRKELLMASFDLVEQTLRAILYPRYRPTICWNICHSRHNI